VKQKSCDNHEDKNTVVGLQKRASNSSNSPPKEGDKGECSRTIVASSIPQACKVYAEDECKCVKQESCDSHEDKNIFFWSSKESW
jgi:hypothetical protein